MTLATFLLECVVFGCDAIQFSQRETGGFPDMDRYCELLWRVGLKVAVTNTRSARPGGVVSRCFAYVVEAREVTCIVDKKVCRAVSDSTSFHDTPSYLPIELGSPARNRSCCSAKPRDTKNCRL